MGESVGVQPDRVAERASALLELGRPQQVIDLIRSTQRGQGLSSELLILLGEAHSALGDDHSAEALARDAFRLDPESAGAAALFARVVAKRDPAAAVPAALAAVRLAPDHWGAYAVLALIAVELPNGRADAWGAARRATELAPDEPDARAVLGQVATRLGCEAVATAALSETLTMDPQHSDAHTVLAAWQADRGRVGSAINGFRRAAAMDAHSSLPFELLRFVARRLLAWLLNIVLLAWVAGGASAWLSPAAALPTGSIVLALGLVWIGLSLRGGTRGDWPVLWAAGRRDARARALFVATGALTAVAGVDLGFGLGWMSTLLHAVPPLLTAVVLIGVGRGLHQLTKL